MSRRRQYISADTAYTGQPQQPPAMAGGQPQQQQPMMMSGQPMAGQPPLQPATGGVQQFPMAGQPAMPAGVPTTMMGAGVAAGGMGGPVAAPGAAQPGSQPVAAAAQQPTPGGVPLMGAPPASSAATGSIQPPSSGRVYFDPETQTEQMEGGGAVPMMGAPGGASQQPMMQQQQPMMQQQQPMMQQQQQQQQPSYPPAFQQNNGQSPHATPVRSIDPAMQCPDNYFRLSVNAIPATKQLWNKSSLPFGAVIHPIASSTGPGNRIPLVNYGAAGVVRCRKCRGYVNPFVQWIEGGRKWRCNFCLVLNECPNAYYSPLGDDGRRADWKDRPELRAGMCEIAASSEYMVRPPQPPAYVFVLDVGYYAAASGNLRRTCEMIKSMLSDWPGEVRARIAFVLYDRELTFVAFDEDVTQPQLMTVPVLEDFEDEVYLPTLADELLCNIDDNQELIEAFLDEIPKAYVTSQCTTGALGSALKAAFALLRNIGGKIVTVAHSLPPSIGTGRIPNREDPKLMGTDREHTLLKHTASAEGQWYKNFALDCSRKQIGVDVFAFTHSSAGYCDLATIGDICQFTGGQLTFYGSYADAVDGPKYEVDLRRYIKRLTGFEAVFRVRCSNGIRVAAHHGNFFIRSSDLLALPNVDADKAFAVTFEPTENTQPHRQCYVQAALLYTSSRGKRRIRVFTRALTVTSSLADLFREADQLGCAALTSRLAIERVISTGISDAREAIVNQLVAMLAVYRRELVSGAPATQLMLPAALQLYPLYLLALIKSAAMRAGERPDDRVAFISNARIISVTGLINMLYPKLYAIHTLSLDEEPASSEESEPELPAEINLSSERLDQAGAYLMDTGLQMFLWVGNQCDPNWVLGMFGVQTLQGADTAAFGLLFNDIEKETIAQRPPVFQRVAEIVRQRRSTHRFAKPRVRVLQQGEPAELKFFQHMVEDRARSVQSYLEFLVSVQQRVSKSISQ